LRVAKVGRIDYYYFEEKEMNLVVVVKIAEIINFDYYYYLIELNMIAVGID
jgi:hypothetical protein